MVRSKSSCLGPCVYREVPDGGWGWVVAAAFFMVEVCTYGTIKSLGIFLQEWMEEFGETNSRVSWVISICVFTLTFTAPLSTFLSNRYGFQPVVMIGGFLISLGTITSAFTRTINEMYITIGIISGLGYCFTFLPTVTILAQYFCRRRALVASIASSGECFAMFAFAPAFTVLKEQIGWRYCLIIIGAIQTSVIGCGALLRPIVIEPEAEPEGPQVSKHLQAQYELENEQTRTSISSGVSQSSGDSGVTSLSASSALAKAVAAEEEVEAGAGPVQPPTPKLLDFSVLKDGAFICYSLFGLLATLGFFAPQLYVVQLSKSRGVEPATASYMLSVIAAGDAAGRLSIGLVLSRARCRKTRVLLAFVVLLCAVLLAFTLVWEFWGLAACCALYGYFMGTVGSTHIPMLAEDDVVGIHRMASSVGVYVFIQSFAGLAGPPLGGMLVDVTHNYGSAFYSCAVGMGLGAVCLALVAPAKSGFCHRPGGRQEEHSSAGEEESMSQDSSQPDFLEMDFVPEPGAVQKASLL